MSTTTCPPKSFYRTAADTLRSMFPNVVIDICIAEKRKSTITGEVRFALGVAIANCHLFKVANTPEAAINKAIVQYREMQSTRSSTFTNGDNY